MQTDVQARRRQKSLFAILRTRQLSVCVNVKTLLVYFVKQVRLALRFRNFLEAVY